MIHSICDSNSFIIDNVVPVQQMLSHLRAKFDAAKPSVRRGVAFLSDRREVARARLMAPHHALAVRHHVAVPAL